jgi:thiol-disulfide isomerase/thioredoxin
MKRILSFIAVSLIVMVVYSQQVPRDKVIVEIGTGTWCQYCPGAALGADDLVANGKQVGIIEYHNGDDYANTYSNYRNDIYYAVPGYPTAHFDGVLEFVGGYHDQSLYPQYLPLYNQRIAIPSSFTIDIEGTNSGLIDFNITVTATKVAEATNTNMVLHMVVTESDIAENWQGLTELDYVERLMVPNQYGTSISFTDDSVQVVNKMFSLDPSWVAENCQLVVFIQDNSTKEVLQGTMNHLTDFGAAYSNDASIIAIGNVDEENCTGSLAPEVTIRNNANADLTSLDINYQVNGGPLSTYAWSGDLGYLQTDMVELPVITFSILPENMIKVYASDPNGSPDQYPANDTITASFEQAQVASTIVYLNFRLDQNPEETTYDLKDAEGNILYSGGPFPGHANQFLKDTFDLEVFQNCFLFTMYDAGGNGMCCDHGFGFYQLFDSDGLVLKQGGQFSYSETTQFESGYINAVPENTATEDISIYPNPAREDINVAFTLAKGEQVGVVVYNLLGDVVYRSNPSVMTPGSHTMTIQTDHLQPGLYIVRFTSGDKVYTRKFSVTK